MKHRSQFFRYFFASVLFIVVVCSAALFLLLLASYRQSERIYTASRAAVAVHDGYAAGREAAAAHDGAAEETAEEEEAKPAPVIEVDFAALQAVNPDVRAWLLIPETDISYPVVQGEDNEFYLHTTYDRKPNSCGSIFIDARNAEPFAETNTILYGHNMKNGSMFGTLRRYEDDAFRIAHPDIYIVTPEGQLQYRVFSAYVEAENGDAYTVDFSTLSEAEFLRRAAGWDSGDVETETPARGSKVLTLSTCTSIVAWQRFVVHAVLVEE